MNKRMPSATQGRPYMGKIYMALIFLFLYIPIFVVIAYSFNSTKYGARWESFTLDWYSQLIGDAKIMEAVVTSLQVAGATCLLSGIVGTLGAVSSLNLGKKLNNLLSGVVYIPLIIPEIVFGVALLMLFAALPIGFGKPALILSHSTFCIPYIYVLVSIRLRAIDKSIIEAARDLGAKSTQLFFTVILPLIFPAIISGVVLSFAMSMDDVVISVFMESPGNQLMSVKIYHMLRQPRVIPRVNALCAFIFLFSFIAVSCLQLAFANKRNKEEKNDKI